MSQSLNHDSSVSLKKNVIANYLGQGWRAIMSLVFVPLYIKYLGIEAYGLIGIFAMLQIWLSLLNVGMKPTLGREMSRFTGGAHNAQSIWDLLRSIEIVSIVIALAVSLSIWALSGWLASDWVKAQSMPLNIVTQAFALMGLVTALQFIESIYTSSLAGLQRQVLQNSVMSIMATVRGFGAVAVLIWVSPSIHAFFIWQGISSVVSLTITMTSVYLILPSPPQTASFSKRELLGVWRFAAGMVGITFLALLLTQVDKILLSHLLTLQVFGYYALAGVVSGGLYMLVSPIAAAFYPRFNELLVRKDDAALCKVYHQSAQLVTVVVGSASLVLILFSNQVLFLWTADRTLTQQVAPIMSVLALGTFLNCLMWIPYQMQLAHGWTSLTIIINAVAVAIFIPAILWIVPIYGANGAAWLWVVLNAGYCLVGVQFMYRRILIREKWTWYFTDGIIPLTAACIAALLCKALFPLHYGRVTGLFLVVAVSAVVLGTSALVAPLVRRQVVRHLLGLRKLYQKKRG